MHIILILLFLFLFLVFVVPTFLLSIIARLFGFFSTKKSVGQENDEPRKTYTHKKSSTNGKNKKIFDKNEGEYVDFEEIK